MKGILFLVISVILTKASACPYDGNFKKWSDEATWDDGQIPDINTDVEINERVMISESVEVNSITIKPNGILVFEQKSDADINIRTKYILIDGGELYAGSDEEGCSGYPGKATITLTGNIGDQEPVQYFGTKFIGVAKDGVLSLHGEEKRSWTRLEQTVNKIEDVDVYSYEKIDQSTMQTGLIIYSFDPLTGKVDSKDSFGRLKNDKQSVVDKAIDGIIQFLSEVKDGFVTGFGTRKSLRNKEGNTEMDRLFVEIEKYCFGENSEKKTAMRESEFYDGFSSICIKGDHSKSVEAIKPYSIGEHHQTSHVSIILGEVKFEVLSFTNFRGHGKSYAEFLVTNAEKSVPILTLAHDVSSWKEGDDVFITSTSGNWKEVEHGAVVDCENKCSNKQIRLNWTPKYQHLGVVYKRVDMRAMVGVLTRNVKVDGEMKDSIDEHGGHIKALKNNRKMRLTNVELSHLGQSELVGNYPVHYHLNENTGDPIVRQNSIHHSYARCVTVHFTHNVLIKDNVCFDAIGHMYFLEDGSEEHTIFDGNLGAAAVRPKLNPPLITTDSKPAVFYLTNPLTTVTNNAAGGGAGDGFWYAIPTVPTGLSTGSTTYGSQEMLRTKITKFRNNAASGHVRSGLRFRESLARNNIDGVLDVRTSNARTYDPLSDPKDENSDPVSAIFDLFTGTNNQGANIDLRGGQFLVTNASLADAGTVTLSIERKGKGRPAAKDCILIGTSPYNANQDKVAIGYNVQRRSVIVDGLYFGDFGPNSGAISPRIDHHSYSTRSSFESITYDYSDPSGGNRVILPAYDESPHKTEIFRDTDGSVTTIKPDGGYVVRDDPFLKTTNCASRENWGNLAICDEKFGRVQVTYSKADPKDIVSIFRGDDENAKMDVIVENKATFNIILRKEDTQYNPITYLLAPSQMKSETGGIGINTFGIDKEYTSIMAVCLPRKDAVISVTPKAVGGPFVKRRVYDINDIYNDRTGGLHFIDEENGVVFFKLLNQLSFTPGEYGYCPGGLCTRYSISITEGSSKDDSWISGCKDRFFNAYPPQPETGSSVRSLVKLLEKRQGVSKPISQKVESLVKSLNRKRALSVPAEIPATPGAAERLKKIGVGKQEMAD